MIPMDMEEFIAEVARVAREKGWWPDGERNFGEAVALMHSELSEALEEWRDGREAIYYKGQEDPRCANPECQHKQHEHDDAPGKKGENYHDGHCLAFPSETIGGVRFAVRCKCQTFVKPPAKPEGVLVEFADLFIRAADLIGNMYTPGLFVEVLREKMAYNLTRAYRHGGKRA